MFFGGGDQKIKCFFFLAGGGVQKIKCFLGGIERLIFFVRVDQKINFFFCGGESKN